MQSITVTWNPAEGAEPSNCFDGFYDKVFELEHVVETNGTMQIVWNSMRDTADGPVILGAIHDPWTGKRGAPVTVRLSDVKSIRYL